MSAPHLVLNRSMLQNPSQPADPSLVLIRASWQLVLSVIVAIYIYNKNNTNCSIIKIKKELRKMLFHCTSMPTFIHFKQSLSLFDSHVDNKTCSLSDNSNHVSERQDGCHVLPHLIWCSGCLNNYSSLCQTIHLCSLTEERKENGRIHMGV